jgi:hypothetical protein
MRGTFHIQEKEISLAVNTVKKGHESQRHARHLCDMFGTQPKSSALPIVPHPAAFHPSADLVSCSSGGLCFLNSPPLFLGFLATKITG